MCEYIDIEDGSLILEDNSFCGSVRYPNKLYVCPKCAKIYFTPYWCKMHFSRCALPKDGIYEVEENNDSLVKIAENLAALSKYYQMLDFRMFYKEYLQKNFKPFIMIEGGKLVGYLVWHLIERNGKKNWRIMDFFLMKRFRGRGKAKELLEYSRKILKIEEFTVEKPNRDMRRFLEKNYELKREGVWF